MTRPEDVRAVCSHTFISYLIISALHIYLLHVPVILLLALCIAPGVYLSKSPLRVRTYSREGLIQEKGLFQRGAY